MLLGYLAVLGDCFDHDGLDAYSKDGVIAGSRL
jgi:hypothetical protein